MVDHILVPASKRAGISCKGHRAGNDTKKHTPQAGEIDTLLPIVAPTRGSSCVVDGCGRIKKSSFKRPNLGGQQLT